MRLSQEQINDVYKTVKSFFNEEFFELYLYGSRVQDQLKGGDIDLLILTNEQGLLLFSKHELDILVQIKKNKSIGQRRIDIKATTHAKLEKDPFLKSIEDQLVLLKLQI